MVYETFAIEKVTEHSYNTQLRETLYIGSSFIPRNGDIIYEIKNHTLRINPRCIEVLETKKLSITRITLPES
jgi:hypothetical protein